MTCDWDRNCNFNALSAKVYGLQFETICPKFVKEILHGALGNVQSSQKASKILTLFFQLRFSKHFVTLKKISIDFFVLITLKMKNRVCTPACQFDAKKDFFGSRLEVNPLLSFYKDKLRLTIASHAFRSSFQEVFSKKGVLRNFTNSQENTCTSVSFLILQLYWKRDSCTPVGMDASQIHLWDVSYSVSETSQRALICKYLRRLAGDWLKMSSQRRLWVASARL